MVLAVCERYIETNRDAALRLQPHWLRLLPSHNEDYLEQRHATSRQTKAVLEYDPNAPIVHVWLSRVGTAQWADVYVNVKYKLGDDIQHVY